MARPRVLKTLSRTMDDVPKIHTFDGVIFTLHNRDNQAVRIADYRPATSVPPNTREDSSPRSTRSTPSTSACNSSSPA